MIEAVAVLFLHCGAPEFLLVDTPSQIRWAVVTERNKDEVGELIEQLRADPAVKFNEIRYDKDCKTST